MTVDPLGTFRQLSRRARLCVLVGLALMALILVTGWGLLQQRTEPPPAGMLEQDEELPAEIPELPADITYGERQEFIPPMVRIEAETAEELDTAFSVLDYDWPVDDSVPALSVGSFPPLGDLSVDERKDLFFQSLLPLIVAENQIMLATREQIGEIFAEGDVESESREERILNTLGERFRVEGDVNSPEFRNELLRRVDAVPLDMALAQAANESGWGQSRFTREANNLFGVWTWHEERGVVPEQRAAGATHFVRIFPDLRASVRNYMYTINVGDAYADLRAIREELRSQGEPLTGERLAEGLALYSERGEEYVTEVQAMIRQNDLQEVDDPELKGVDARRLLDDADEDGAEDIDVTPDADEADE